MSSPYSLARRLASKPPGPRFLQLCAKPFPSLQFAPYRQESPVSLDFAKPFAPILPPPHPFHFGDSRRMVYIFPPCLSLGGHSLALPHSSSSPPGWRLFFSCRRLETVRARADHLSQRCFSFPSLDKCFIRKPFSFLLLAKVDSKVVVFEFFFFLFIS